VTPKDLGLWSNEGIFPTIMIAQGEVIKDNLDRLGVSIEQMLRQLNQQGVTRLKDISAAWIDEEGNIRVKLVNDGSKQ